MGECKRGGGSWDELGTERSTQHGGSLNKAGFVQSRGGAQSGWFAQ